MAERKNVIEFENGFHGVVHAAGSEIVVAQGVVEPYDMTFGALASCFYSTLLAIAEKNGVEISKATITVTGEKRETVPTTLSRVNLDLVLTSNASEEKLRECVRKASETCSMYQTICQVAEMSWQLHLA